MATTENGKMEKFQDIEQEEDQIFESEDTQEPRWALQALRGVEISFGHWNKMPARPARHANKQTRMLVKSSASSRN